MDMKTQFLDYSGLGEAVNLIKKYIADHKEILPYASLGSFPPSQGIIDGIYIDTATNSIDRGMPVEEIKEILGHVKLDTPLIYAKVSKENIKHDHRKYII